MGYADQGSADRLSRGLLAMPSFVFLEVLVLTRNATGGGTSWREAVSETVNNLARDTFRRVVASLGANQPVEPSAEPVPPIFPCIIPMPTSLTGDAGLMNMLGLASARAYDGSGSGLLLHPILGWVAAGSDGMGGTDDDM